ncbi:uncharacterized protein LOC109710562 isoform X1 [Ananas comosus]|uniref:Uncharacterized protein LOC109710562 isoform X1 n=1 Tax=Ananas comosus TaxID=4615 RepID=A0A6P5EYA6_ANACO|nr:uncharacterized protein LOC109710562 isoform X1 [Ananas comosus]XP_020088832.1 uncharacterized protein LOC109710562 isoform X1 [Ananas comosus]XP_020088833.1 uncharacterized protein LOC109710562 isoform X1 [Ananas comosus]
MGYHENLQLYLNLPRKELQKLCKEHNLPANKSHSQLAKSLTSFFKKKTSKTSRSAPPKEGLVSHIQVTADMSCVPLSKTKEMVPSTEETARGACERNHFPGNDTHELSQGTNKKMRVDRLHLQTGSKMAFNSTAIILSPSPANNVTAEVLGSSSSSIPGIVGNSKSLSAIQEKPVVEQFAFECHEHTVKGSSGKPFQLTNYGKKLHNSETGSGTYNTIPIQGGLASPEEISTKATPSFEFFVMSEDGINLCVDLDSTPSSWIKSLKDEVCIHKREENCKSGILPNFVCDIVNDDGEAKTSPSLSTMVDLQSKGVEKRNNCTDSSLCSVVSENCQSSGLTSICTPVGTSDIHNQMASDSACCPVDKEVLPQKAVNVSSGINTSNSQVPGASREAIGNINLMNPVIVGSNDSAACELRNTPESSAELKNDSISIEVGENLGDDHHKNLVVLNEVSVESRLMERSAEDALYGGGLSNCCQVAGQLSFDLPVTDAQSDVGSADQPFVENYFPEDPMPTNEALDNSTSTKRKVSSESSSDCPDRHSERSHIPEGPEEFQSKRQNICGESMSGTMINFRSTNISTKETQYDPTLVPRRSTRLVPK